MEGDVNEEIESKRHALRISLSKEISGVDTKFLNKRRVGVKWWEKGLIEENTGNWKLERYRINRLVEKVAFQRHTNIPSETQRGKMQNNSMCLYSEKDRKEIG